MDSGQSSAAVSAVSPTKWRDSRNNSSSTRVASSARTIADFTAGKSRLSVNAAIAQPRSGSGVCFR